MKRLFTGQPTRTDGRLTKQNRWREAGVSRATLHLDEDERKYLFDLVRAARPVRRTLRRRQAADL